MEERVCSFCGNPIEPGTGSMFVRRDGTIHLFCSSKCRKNLLGNRRIPRRVRWTRFFEKGEVLRAETKRVKPETSPVKPKEARKKA